MKLVSFLFNLLVIYCVFSYAEKENLKKTNKYYIISIKDSNKYSFKIQFDSDSKENKLQKRDLNHSEKFIPLGFNEVKDLLKSDHCISEIRDKNLNDTTLCDLQKESSSLFTHHGKLNILQLEKKLKPNSNFVSNQMEKLAELILRHVDSYEKDDVVTGELQNLKYKRSTTTTTTSSSSSFLKEILDSNQAFSKILRNPFNILDVSVIFAYLSEELYEIIKELPDVVSCNENVIIPFPNDKIFSITNMESIGSMESMEKDKSKSVDKRASKFYDLSDIKNDTQWSDVSVRENTYNHLSLISQSKFDKNLIGQYDSNYYYPSSAGKGVDIYILDSGIDVHHADFELDTGNTGNGYRTVSCDAMFGDKEIINQPGSSSYKNCFLEEKIKYHGSMVASIAAGKIHGVAKNANIHMVVHNRQSTGILLAYNFVKNNLKDPHKTVINLSFGSYKKIPEEVSLINSLIEMGCIVVAAGGNDNISSCTTEPRYVVSDDDNKVKTLIQEKIYPASLENVIGVGSIRNKIKETDVSSVQNLYSLADFSNYGDCLDLFAPGYAYAAYPPPNNNDKSSSDLEGYGGGSSFSAPLVAGVAASIISEHPEMTFNHSLMKKMLLEISVEGILDQSGIHDSPNNFLNIGKKTVYSANNQYKGCGIFSGKRSCSNNECCSSSTGYCGRNDDYCGSDCQSEFGYCTSSNSNNNSNGSNNNGNTTNNNDNKSNNDNSNGNNNEEQCWSLKLGYSCCPTGTKVYSTDSDGDWGVHNHKWCGIIKHSSSDSSSPYCFSEALGYPCCTNNSRVYFIGESGSWGIQDDQWCGIIGTSTYSPDNSYHCFSESLGYPCCTNNSKVYYTDKHGSWGLQDNEWRGI